MSLFQSALDFLAGPGSLGAASRDQNDFVGQTVEMGDMKLRIKRVIAEGKRGRQQAAPGVGRGGPDPPLRGWAGLPLGPRASRSLSPRLPFRGCGGFPFGRPCPARVEALWGRTGGGARPAGSAGFLLRGQPAPRRACCVPIAAFIRGRWCTELT